MMVKGMKGISMGSEDSCGGEVNGREEDESDGEEGSGRGEGVEEGEGGEVSTSWRRAKRLPQAWTQCMVTGRWNCLAS
jgi:hypothetical protein